MPPFRPSRAAHEAVDGTYRVAELATERVRLQEDAHKEVNIEARRLVSDYGTYNYDGSVTTPWVYNDELTQPGGRRKSVAYQLRTINEPGEVEDQGEFGEITLVVRVSRHHPTKPGRFITQEEPCSIINSRVIFSGYHEEPETYTYIEGIGVKMPETASRGTPLPIGLASELSSEHFDSTIETLLLMSDALDGTNAQ